MNMTHTEHLNLIRYGYIYNAVSPGINQYVLDIEREGYWATIHVVNGGTPPQVRNYIHNRNPVDALLVGAIPPHGMK